MLKKLMAKMQKEEGQGLVEYALIIVLVSIACILALTALGTSVNSVFNKIVAHCKASLQRQAGTISLRMRRDLAIVRLKEAGVMFATLGGNFVRGRARVSWSTP